METMSPATIKEPVECTVWQTVDLVSRRWMLLVLMELYKGDSHTRRYSDLKRRLGSITPKILSQRLKDLEAEGLITKTIDASTIPVATYYTLTESGIAFFDVIRALKTWALTWKVENKMCSMQDCRQCVAGEH